MIDLKIKRGQILKDLRESKHLRQSDLANILDVTQQAYQRYESGTSEPNGETMCKLADFYGVTTDYLLGREPPTPDVITPTDEELETALLEAYRAMPEDARKDFLDHIREAVLAERKSGIYVERNLGELEDERRRTEEEREKGGKFA